MDWHSDPLTGAQELDAQFRITQNVRRFLTAELGFAPTLGPRFHAWLRTEQPETLDAVVRHLRSALKLSGKT